MCSRAISSALEAGTAILKVISANDAGATGAHQYGPLLPHQKDAWRVFTPHPPVRGDDNPKHEVTVRWHDGRVTDSVVTWYGHKKAEYRLTRFGKGFPHFRPDAVGNLLVLVPRTLDQFEGFVLETDEDIDDLLAALGVDLARGWALYDGSQLTLLDDPIQRRFDEFLATLSSFPKGAVFAATATGALLDGSSTYLSLSLDDQLVQAVDTESDLFYQAEWRLLKDVVKGPFSDMESFIEVANSTLQRRKSRRGQSLENHVDILLNRTSIPHEMRPSDIYGVPDVVIPSSAAYADSSYPRDKVVILACKSTCKDRWRQVLEEGPLVPTKHLMTLQPGISRSQLKAMQSADVRLIVPESLHAHYAPKDRSELMSVESFVEKVRVTLGE
jgi:EcoRII C terminal/Restriction endonuclease EcoRII, N-terminal